MMSIEDHVVISVLIPRIDNECSLEKEFIKLICMNPLMVLYIIANQVHSYHGYVCGPLT